MELAASVAIVSGSALVAWRWWLAARREEYREGMAARREELTKAREAFDVRLTALELRVSDAVDVAQRLSKLETANAYRR